MVIIKKKEIIKLETKIRIENPCHYQHGKKTAFAFVFSCPGQVEEKNGRPVSGKTGDNLDVLLEYLNLNKEEIRITNAWPLPEYKNKTGRSEAPNQEIKSRWNLARLENELLDIKGFIVCFGEKAKLAIESTNLIKNKLIFIRHLGLQSINQIKIDSSTERKNKTSKRLVIIAKEIRDKINKNAEFD